MSIVNEKDVLLSGGFGTSSNSARAGFLPICLERAPIGAFDHIPLYLRNLGETRAAKKESFTLYCTENVTFSPEHRQRLVSHGVKFVYIPMVMQAKFRQQTEECLLQMTEDPSMAISVKSEIV